MSGHNPHGRHGQPVNSSQWNHLQVPSYIPRQPQLAHMSNERSIRSPLAWHHTANNSAEALYGYMAAAAAAAAASSSNHKTTPLDINPLLPFVRSASNPMPFGSVDLSISSGTRNSMTPSPRSQISPAASNNIPSTSSTAQHENNLPSQESLAMFAEMSEQLAAMKANSAMAANLFARELQPPPPTNFSLNPEIARPPSNHGTPMELIKESNFNENDSFSAAALPLHQLFSANSPNVPQNLNELSKSLLTLISNTSTSNAQLGVASTHHPSTNPDLTKSSASTSNDESVDSQTCNGDDGNHKKTRCRRRKPQKTIRMANDATTTPLANGNCTENNSQSQKSSAKPAEDTSQTQSMDLSNYSAGHDAFSNGKLANSIYSATAAKPMNGFASMNMSRYPDPSNSMASASSNHLKAAFNTDDLVKRVEEIVKCNSNDAPTNFSAPRSDDENKSSIGPLSNGGDKNGDIIQPATVETRSSETKMNGNENGIDLKTSHETDAKKSKTSLDEVPLMPNAEVKLPEISLPVANSTPKHNHVEEVENHLEKMFSHIENVTVSAASDTTTTATTSTSTNAGADDTTQNESENQNSQTNNDTNNDSELTAKSNDQPATSSTAATPSTSRKKPPRSRKRPAASGRKKVGQSARRPPNKSNTKANGKNAAKNSNASKNNKNVKSNRNAEKSDSKKAKEELAAAESVAKFRGPYIQIQEDGSECIINAPITEEIIEKQNKNRKIVIHSGSGARSKVSGLHVSTLSTKYDAITTDASWMCVFCKLGPHKYGLGDLFGPFILSVDSEEFQESQFDPSEDVFRSHRTNADMVQVKGGMKVVPAKASTSSAATANNTGNSSCRKKRKLTEPSTSTAPPIIVPDIFHGMTKVSEIAYEVWVHEDCVVWSDGVYIVGARIVGLDAAVWSCSRHKCSICEQYGAAVTCFERGCKIEAHVPCAKRSHWSLNEANFQTHCKQHAIAEVDGADTARSDEERQ